MIPPCPGKLSFQGVVKCSIVEQARQGIVITLFLEVGGQFQKPENKVYVVGYSRETFDLTRAECLFFSSHGKGKQGACPQAAPRQKEGSDLFTVKEGIAHKRTCRGYDTAAPYGTRFFKDQRGIDIFGCLQEIQTSQQPEFILSRRQFQDGKAVPGN